MKDKHNLNLIYEIVYEKNIKQPEKFMHKYDRSDDRILKEEKSKKETQDIKR